MTSAGGGWMASSTGAAVNAAEPIRRRSLKHEVADRLLASIRSGEFTPGEELPSEHTLMARYGVGRPAVREALQRLEAMGLISISHGERARMLEPSPERLLRQLNDGMVLTLAVAPHYLEHLKEARLVFEAGMVRLAAEKATDADLARLRAILDGSAAALAAGNHARFVEDDMAFHRAIAAINGNPLFATIAETVFAWLSTFHVREVHASGLEHLTLREHEAILRKLKERDGAGAERAMRRHLTRANKLYRRL